MHLRDHKMNEWLTKSRKRKSIYNNVTITLCFLNVRHKETRIHIYK